MFENQKSLSNSSEGPQRSVPWQDPASPVSPGKAPSVRLPAAPSPAVKAPPANGPDQSRSLGPDAETLESTGNWGKTRGTDNRSRSGSPRRWRARRPRPQQTLLLGVKGHRQALQSTSAASKSLNPVDRLKTLIYKLTAQHGWWFCARGVWEDRQRVRGPPGVPGALPEGWGGLCAQSL